MMDKEKNTFKSWDTVKKWGWNMSIFIGLQNHQIWEIIKYCPYKGQWISYQLYYDKGIAEREII